MLKLLAVVRRSATIPKGRSLINGDDRDPLTLNLPLIFFVVVSNVLCFDMIAMNLDLVCMYNNPSPRAPPVMTSVNRK